MPRGSHGPTGSGPGGASNPFLSWPCLSAPMHWVSIKTSSVTVTGNVRAACLSGPAQLGGGSGVAQHSGGSDAASGVRTASW